MCASTVVKETWNTRKTFHAEEKKYGRIIPQTEYYDEESSNVKNGQGILKWEGTKIGSGVLLA